jgi:hypothetical protein
MTMNALTTLLTLGAAAVRAILVRIEIILR